MSMEYECTECGHEFDSRTLYCEDWRDPKKSLGCPKCQTFFLLKEAPKKHSTKAFVISLIAGFLYALLAYIYIGPSKVTISSAIAVITLVYAIAKLFIFGPPKFVKLEPIRESSTNR